eukprot:jgi/Chrzof1/7785/Cz02g36190.t1
MQYSWVQTATACSSGSLSFGNLSSITSLKYFSTSHQALSDAQFNNGTPNDSSDTVATLSRRVETLERQLQSLTDSRHSSRRSDHTSEQHKHASSKEAGKTEDTGDQQSKVEDTGEAIKEEGAEAMRKIHPQIIDFLNSGYLESQKMVRERIMQQEWEETVRPWSMRKGVSDFEKYCAENDKEVDYDTMSRLYENPEDLSVLKDGKLRELARAMIEQAMHNDQWEVYKKAIDSAKGLANIVESGQSTGLGAIWNVVKRFIPLPFFR